MSAAPLVLPLIWATAEAARNNLSLVTERKGPHRLRLVQANEVPAESATGVRRHGTEKLEHGNYAFYRKYTEGMLLRSMKMSLESGRIPSFLGREVFRGGVTSYKVQGFDDVVIFVTDVTKCLETLSRGQQYLVRRIAMQQYTHQEVAAMLGISLRTVIRRYYEALDELTRLFLSRKLMQPLMAAQGEV